MASKKKATTAQRKKAGLPLYLSLAPQHITADAWYYEEKTGVHLVIWGPEIPGHTREVQHFHIKWRQMLDTMRRYRRFKNTSVSEQSK